MKSSTFERLSDSPIPIAARPLLVNLSLATLITTLLLIGVGSFVRVTGHGLGCPDWPLCYGRAIPPLDISAWVEFSHRLLAGIVGLQIIALAVLAWRRHRDNQWIFRPALAAVAVLIVQVSLGGSHVLNELPAWTGLTHTAVAMIIAALMAVLVAVTHPALQEMGARTAVSLRGTRLWLWTAVAAGATYLLMITGTLVTRTGASLACPSFPHCGLVAIPDYLRHLITIQMIHRYSAFTVAFAIGLVVWYLLRYGQGDRGLRHFALLLALLLTTQFALGMSNVWLALPIWSRVLHLMVGGTIWVVMVILAVTLYHGRRAPSPATTTLNH